MLNEPWKLPFNFLLLWLAYSLLPISFALWRLLRSLFHPGATLYKKAGGNNPFHPLETRSPFLTYSSAKEPVRR